MLPRYSKLLTNTLLDVHKVQAHYKRKRKMTQ